MRQSPGISKYIVTKSSVYYLNNLEMLVVNVSVDSEETLKDGFSNVEKVVRKRNSNLARK